MHVFLQAMALPSASTDAYRLVNGEGDRLSGLAIDVYAGEVVVSSSARWIEVHREAVKGAVERVCGGEGVSVWWRLSMDRLRQDGFETSGGVGGEEIASGVIPEGQGGQKMIVENGLSYSLDLEVCS